MGFFDDDEINDSGNGGQNDNGYNQGGYNFNPNGYNQGGGSYNQGGGKTDDSYRRMKKLTLIMALVMVGVMILSVVLCAVITTQVFNDKVDEAVKDYKREYYLPTDYSNVALSVIDANLDSVLELTCTATVNKQTVTGAATGFIITSDGYVITNCHVVTYEYQSSTGKGWWQSTTIETAEYDSITANFISTSSLYKAGGYRMKVISTDSRNDLALLQFVDMPSSIKPLTFCDSDLLTLGEETVVIGNAEGYGLAVTTGVISNPHRTFKSTDDNGTYTRDVLQTDAALNPGNSGGPICNIYNEIIGVATFKLVDTENEGLGFGVLSNVVTDFIDSVATAKNITVNYTVSERGQ